MALWSPAQTQAQLRETQEGRAEAHGPQVTDMTFGGRVDSRIVRGTEGPASPPSAPPGPASPQGIPGRGSSWPLRPAPLGPPQGWGAAG